MALIEITILSTLVILSTTLPSAQSWQAPRSPPATVSSLSAARHHRSFVSITTTSPPRKSISALNLFGQEETDSTATVSKPRDNKEEQPNGALSSASDTKNPDVESTTEKYGLEAGLFQSLRQKDGGESAKSLLKKYGIAYLATSIPLAIVSFAICYVLVDNGVDVAGLLAKVGITGAYTEKAGTFAIAYAAHKAASPIRFPPTVLLTPVVAKLIGKEPEEEEEVEGEKEE